MIFVVVVIIAALVIVIGFRSAVRGFASDVSDPELLLQHTRPIDLDAFRNLIEPDDDAYLHNHLSSYSLFRVRQARCLAAIEYVQMAAQNAAILVRLGQAARSSHEARIREDGRELLGLAVETRILAGLALVQLSIAFALPWWHPSLQRMLTAYIGLRGRLDRFVRWQRPELAGRLIKAL
jgi:hypothetical protein